MVKTDIRIGGVFDGIPPELHHMGCLNVSHSREMGHFIIADNPNTPRTYFVFRTLEEVKPNFKESKVKLIAICNLLERAVYAMKKDYHNTRLAETERGADCEKVDL